MATHDASPIGSSAQKVHGRVVVVDDHDLVRAGIADILNRSQLWEVCALGGTERDALLLVENHRPDILVLDLCIDLRDGISLIKDLVVRYPETKILSISPYADLSYAERAMCAGSLGLGNTRGT